MDHGQRAAFAAAAVLAVAWLAWPAPDRPETTAAAPEAAPTVWEVFDREPVDWPGTVDGRAWEPLRILEDTRDGSTALGTDGAGSLFYVELDADGAASLTVLAEPGAVPGVVAAAATDERIAWLASVPDDRGRVASQLWTAARGADGRPDEPVLLTADTGDVITAGSAYDLQFAVEGLQWLAAARGGAPATEQRWIGVDGGAVTVTEHAGAWQAAAWPWLASSGSDALGGARLVRTDTGAGLRVVTAEDELTICSATWCRLVANTAEGARTDLVRPDGTDRVTVAEGFASAVSPDAGLVDRWEPLAEAAPGAVGAAEVTLFDLQAGEAYLVASAAGGAGADDGALWWSTGTAERLEWHVLDLTDLA